MTDTFLEKFEERRAARARADRTITIAGAELTFRPAVAPEVGIRLQDTRRLAAEKVAEVRRHIAEANGSGVDATIMGSLVSDAEMIEVADETVLACLDPSSHAAWAELRSPDNSHPVTFEEVFEIADYLLGRVSGIPTVAPAGSSGGRKKTGKGSSESSSSPATAPTT